jgi:hypothetical protein
VSVSGNVIGGNISTAGNVTGAYIKGDGSQLTNITVTSSANSIANGTSNINIATANGNVTMTVSGISNVAVMANTGVYITGVLSASGNITGNNISATSHTGTVVSVSGNITGGNVLASTISNAASFTGGLVSVSGNVTAGNLLTGGAISATGNITAGNIIGTIVATGVSLSGNLTASSVIAGNIVNAASYTGGLISVTGTVTSASVVGGAITGSSLSVSGTVTSSSSTGLTLNATNAGMEIGNPTATNTPYIDFHTSGSSPVDYDFRILGSGGTNGVTNGTGTLQLQGALVTASGNVTAAGQITVNSSNLATAIVNGAPNAQGNIGSTSSYFNQVFAQATTALYADLAEVYEADADYAPGTVVSFGGSKEVTLSQSAGDPAVAGVISANPSYLMNNGLTADHRAIVALTGRVPTSVTGTVSKGAMMVSAGNGRAQACATPDMGTVIGKALENFDGESGVIEIVVGRM